MNPMNDQKLVMYDWNYVFWARPNFKKHLDVICIVSTHAHIYIYIYTVIAEIHGEGRPVTVPLAPQLWLDS